MEASVKELEKIAFECGLAEEKILTDERTDAAICHDLQENMNKLAADRRR